MGKDSRGQAAVILLIRSVGLRACVESSKWFVNGKRRPERAEHYVYISNTPCKHRGEKSGLRNPGEEERKNEARCPPPHHFPLHTSVEKEEEEDGQEARI